MTEDRQELLEHYRQMRKELLAAIEGLSDELLSEPSREIPTGRHDFGHVVTVRVEEGWSVKDHLAHLALWDDLRASEVIRISAGHDSAWRMAEVWPGADIRINGERVEDQVEVYNALAHHLRRGMSVDQAKWELATSGQRVLDAISSASERGLDGSLYYDASLRSTHEAQHTEWIKRWRGERRV
jgi:hypothetical protein